MAMEDKRNSLNQAKPAPALNIEHSSSQAPVELYLTFLGRFSIRCPTSDGPGAITEEESTSKRLWAFLQYLCTSHNKRVTQEEIIEILWDNVEISNPVNTLKTLLHRSRLLLEKLGFPDGKQVLLYRHGYYSWNPDLVFHTDISDFESLCAQFSAVPHTQEGLDAARKALTLYQGDFLPNSSGSPWTISPRAYYHKKYMELCCEAASALWDAGCLDEATGICRNAAALDPFDEPCQMLMMRLLCASGAKQAAVQYYSHVSSLFMDHLGVTPSEEMTAFYRELTKSGETLEMDLQTVRTRLLETDPLTGPYFCEYAVFQDIFCISVRSTPRTGQVVQLAMITILDLNGAQLPGERCSTAMEELKKAILSHLRAGDIFTRFSPAQYLLLLPRTSYENGSAALERALSSYRNTLSGRTTLSQTSLLPVLRLNQKESIAKGFSPRASGEAR